MVRACLRFGVACAVAVVSASVAWALRPRVMACGLGGPGGARTLRELALELSPGWLREVDGLTLLDAEFSVGGSALLATLLGLEVKRRLARSKEGFGPRA